MLPGARHRDVKKAPFFLDLLTGTYRHVRRDAAIDHVEDEYRVPLLPLGGMDRRKNEVVLVEVRRCCLGAGGLRRIEGQLAEKASAGRVSPGDLLELVEIAGARADIVVQAFEMRLIPPANQIDLSLPDCFLAQPAK